MERGTILNFTAYELIKSFEGYGEQFRFNKFMFLLNKELKKEKIDIKLPYCWYRYGIVVDLDINNLNYLSSLDFSEISISLRSKIINTINLVMEKYRYKKTPEINAEIYQEAPYKFQDDFREILKIIDLWKSNKTLDEYLGSEPSYLLKFIKKTVNDYPSDDFNDIYPLFLEWENYTTHLIEINYPNKKIASFIEKFWFTFARKLRLLTNVNIDQTVIEGWEKDYDKYKLNLENFLFNFSFEFFTKYYTPSEEHLESVEELHRIASKTIWE